MTYALPQNMTDMVSVMEYANDVSGGYYGIGILISFFIIVFAYLKIRGTEAEDCFVVSSFMTSFVCLILFLMNLVGNTEFYICILLLCISLLWSFFSRD